MMTLPEKTRASEVRCLICGKSEAIRLFGVCVDGEPLRLQAPLCDDHGDEYLIRVGRSIGEFLTRQKVARLS